MSMVIPENNNRQINQPQRPSCAVLTSAPTQATRSIIPAITNKKIDKPNRMGFPTDVTRVYPLASVVVWLPARAAKIRIVATMTIPRPIRYRLRLSDLLTIHLHDKCVLAPARDAATVYDMCN